MPKSQQDNSEFIENDNLGCLHDKITTIKTRNFLQLTNLPSVLDRYKISDRVGAAIASATLLDVGIINKEDQSKIIDQSKIRRARTKKRNELQSEVY